MSGFGHCEVVELFAAPDGGAVLVLGDDFAHAHLDSALCRNLAEALLACVDDGCNTNVDELGPRRPVPPARRARPRRRRRR